MQKALAGRLLLALAVSFLSATAAAVGARPALHESGAALAAFPVVEFLVAFFGAGLILTFLPREELDGQGVRTWLRLFGTILFCAFVGALGAPFLVRWLVEQDKLFAGAELLAAFASAGALQLILPPAIERRKEIIAWAIARLPWGKNA